MRDRTTILISIPTSIQTLTMHNLGFQEPISRAVLTQRLAIMGREEPQVVIIPMTMVEIEVALTIIE